MPNPARNPGTARLLFGDATLAFLLVNETRHRVVGRLFGLPRADSNVLTVFAVGSLAAGLAAGAARLGRLRPHPSVGGAAMGAAALKETAHGIAGDWSRGSPVFGTLIVLVLLEKSVGPALRGSLHAALTSFHGVAGTLRRLRSLLEVQGSEDQAHTTATVDRAPVSPVEPMVG